MKNESIATSYCINIPEDATNGDVIMAMFPNADYEIGKQFVHITNINSIGELSIPLEWWNALYKRESGETDDYFRGAQEEY